MGAPRDPRPVVCVGELYTDVVMAELDDPPAASREVKAQRFWLSPGGGAAIAAAALARLGHPAWLVSAAGSDPLSEMSVRALIGSGVRVEGLVRLEGRPGNVTVALSVPEGWGTGELAGPRSSTDRALVTFRGVGLGLPLQRLAELLERLSTPAAYGQGQGPAIGCHVHFAGGEPAALGEVARLSRAVGATVSADVGWEMAARHSRHVLGVLETEPVDVFFCNEEEARALTGAADAEVALAHLGRLVDIAVVKRGPRGAVVRYRGGGSQETLRMGAPVVRAVETTGAGDAFCGGFLYGFVRGWPPEACLGLAVWVGSLWVTRAGGIERLPDLAELSRATRSDPEGARLLGPWLRLQPEGPDGARNI